MARKKRTALALVLGRKRPKTDALEKVYEEVIDLQQNLPPESPDKIMHRIARMCELADVDDLELMKPVLVKMLQEYHRAQDETADEDEVWCQLRAMMTFLIIQAGKVGKAKEMVEALHVLRERNHSNCEAEDARKALKAIKGGRYEPQPGTLKGEQTMAANP